MKKIITYITFFAALVIAASCNKENISIEEGSGLITLRLQTSALETRAGDTPTEEQIENTVTHADFFFFSDEAGTTLLNHTRLNVESGQLVAKSGNIYEYTFDVRSNNNPLQKTSYLYVIANYPKTITETTLEGIMGLDIETDLSEEFSSFVMDSYNSTTEGYVYQLVPTKREDAKTFTIELRRVAAKLVLNINVVNSFTDAKRNVWTPVTNQMWVNFINARKTAIVSAQPVAFDEKANYFNTEQETPTSVTTAPEGFTSWKVSSVYTYPQSYQTSDVTAPYFKIFCPWKCTKYNMANFYYKIILPDLGSFQRNKIYNLTVNLSTIGGDQDDWALVTDNIYVADWWAPEKIEASYEGAMYLDVPVKSYEIYGIDELYIPVVSSNDIQIDNNATTVTGTKTNLYDGTTQSVTATISNISKDGFRLTHVLNDDITSTNYDCTPITYTFNVRHTAGGLSKTIPVTVVQYPSIYVSADESNGYAYVNSYANHNISGGRYHTTGNGYNAQYDDMSYNSQGTADQNSLGRMNYLGSSTSQNNNKNQYVVTVSVLPVGYKVSGMTEEVVIGDPRGGKLTNDYLGYTSTSGSNTTDVKSNYNAVSRSTQNVIAPSLRIASSWGATTFLTNSDRAEERCAAYQENGYPAGRWRIPTVAEIDFLIRLSTYNHIPALFTTEKATKYRRSGGGWFSDYNYTADGIYYGGYWSNGPSIYTGVPYLEDHSSPYVLGSGTTSSTTYYTEPDQNNNNQRYAFVPVVLNGEYFDVHVRCVYDEWYWGSNKYNNSGNEITGTGTAATQWIGYKF